MPAEQVPIENWSTAPTAQPLNGQEESERSSAGLPQTLKQQVEIRMVESSF